MGSVAAEQDKNCSSPSVGAYPFHTYPSCIRVGNDAFFSRVGSLLKVCVEQEDYRLMYQFAYGQIGSAVRSMTREQVAAFALENGFLTEFPKGWEGFLQGKEGQADGKDQPSNQR